MFLYLVRHGEALNQIQDEKRALTEKGKYDAKQIALFLKKQNVSLNEICHSTKVRSQQTAHIIANELILTDKLCLSPPLEPDNNIQELIKLIFALSQNTLLVGHLPNLEILCQFLLKGDANQSSIIFLPASVVCLQKEDEIFSLKWQVSPEELYIH